MREHVAGVFALLLERRGDDLRRFVAWLLAKARFSAEHFEAGYKFGSFVVYTFGRPRHAVRARLAREVERAALDLNIPVPDSVKLPAMPDLDIPTVGVMQISGGPAVLFRAE